MTATAGALGALGALEVRRAILKKVEIFVREI